MNLPVRVGYGGVCGLYVVLLNMIQYENRCAWCDVRFCHTRGRLSGERGGEGMQNYRVVGRGIETGGIDHWG